MSDVASKISTQEGGCQCGAVRYRTTSNPVRAMACHCKTCKLRTGAPYGIGVYYQQNDVDIFQGELAKFRFESDTTGRWIQNEFCTQCGSTISWTLEMRPGLRAIAGGSFDNPNWYDIEAHIWTRSARSDMCYPKEVGQYEQALTD